VWNATFEVGLTYCHGLCLLGQFRGTVTEVVETILARSILESDHIARVSLAECIGEVGAIDANLLDEEVSITTTGTDMSVDLVTWRTSNPPWRSGRLRYEVKLVTTHLVHGLKAAPTSSDQNKIAFCIQQLLVLLDNSVRQAETSDSVRRAEATERTHQNVQVLPNSPDRGVMSDWLRTQLTDAGVVEIVEPYWVSEFHEVEGSSHTKVPPYFQKSSTFFSWMSNWCRHMISRSHEVKSPWSPLFYACRTAVRSTAGLSTAEFLLPLLVLDGICFGNVEDRRILIDEMRDALASPLCESSTMDWTERQKAVNAVFSVIDTLLLWAEETHEKRHQKSKTGVSSKTEAEKNTWSGKDADDIVFQIDAELPRIPLSLRAQAAAKTGMNARALRLVEIAVREAAAGSVFNGGEQSNDDLDWKWHRSRAAGILRGKELDLLNGILAELQDYETMGALEQNASDPLSNARDGIRYKEAKGDWSGALPDYERALQLSSDGLRDPVLQRGCLRCLLELGQYESVLNQVNGIVYTANKRNDAAVDLVLPMGVEAAWRLGRWDTLSELVSTGNDLQTKPETQFQQSVGRLMLGIHQKQIGLVELELHKARGAIMGLLSSSARESYSRAYEHVVKLQSLREIEDVAPVLCKGPDVDMLDATAGLGWQRRLELVSSSGIRSVAKSRLALSRLAKDEAMEGSLFLLLGQQARKSRLFDLAATCFSQAEAVLNASKQGRLMLSDTARKLQLQVAKLKHACGESSAALKILSLYDDVESAAGVDQERLASEVSRRISLPSREGTTTIDKQAIGVFVRGVLQSTLWMIEGGLKSSAQVMRRFHVIHRIAPDWERGMCLL
jgi:FAT domain